MPGPGAPPDPVADPVRAADDEARAVARALLAGARFCALGVRDPEDGLPAVSRIALATAPDGTPLSLVSALSAHTRALRADPAAALLVGEPGDRGDPLVHPRLSLKARARFVDRGDPGHADLAAHYLALRPKATLYADLPDFAFVRFEVTSASLNGGFGRAYRLAPADLGLPDPESPRP